MLDQLGAAEGQMMIEVAAPVWKCVGCLSDCQS